MGARPHIWNSLRRPGLSARTVSTIAAETSLPWRQPGNASLAWFMSTTCTSPLEDIRSSLQDAVKRGSPVALKCTLAAASRAVEGALVGEAVAERAALSLAQRERLSEMRLEMEEASKALCCALDAGAAQVAPPLKAHIRGLLRRMSSEGRPGRTPSWQEAVTDVLLALRDGADRLTRLAAGQPAEAPSRALAEATAGLLADHYDRVEDQARHWRQDR